MSEGGNYGGQNRQINQQGMGEVFLGFHNAPFAPLPPQRIIPDAHASRAFRPDDSLGGEGGEWGVMGTKKNFAHTLLVYLPILPPIITSLTHYKRL